MLRDASEIELPSLNIDRRRGKHGCRPQMRWTHPQCTADWLLSPPPAADAADAGDSDAEDVDLQPAIRLVQRYRISSTFRDCSIMISFQRIARPCVIDCPSGSFFFPTLPQNLPFPCARFHSFRRKRLGSDRFKETVWLSGVVQARPSNQPKELLIVVAQIVGTFFLAL